jgi:hypothetical protein
MIKHFMLLTNPPFRTIQILQNFKKAHLTKWAFLLISFYILA